MGFSFMYYGGMITLSAALLLSSGIAQAQTAPNDTERTIKFQVSVGGGAVYENFGNIGGLQMSYGHFILASRFSSMIPESGPGGLFNFFQTTNLPKEAVTDFALMGGYGSFGRKAFAEILVGPSYSLGTLRGAFDSATFMPGIFGGSDTTARYFERKDFHNFGFTIEGRAAFNLGDNVGFGTSIFLTRCSPLLYMGISLDIVIGILR